MSGGLMGWLLPPYFDITPPSEAYEGLVITFSIYSYRSTIYAWSTTTTGTPDHSPTSGTIVQGLNTIDITIGSSTAVDSTFTFQVETLSQLVTIVPVPPPFESNLITASDVIHCKDQTWNKDFSEQSTLIQLQNGPSYTTPSTNGFHYILTYSMKHTSVAFTHFFILSGGGSPYSSVSVGYFNPTANTSGLQFYENGFKVPNYGWIYRNGVEHSLNSSQFIFKNHNTSGPSFCFYSRDLNTGTDILTVYQHHTTSSSPPLISNLQRRVRSNNGTTTRDVQVDIQGGNNCHLAINYNIAIHNTSDHLNIIKYYASDLLHATNPLQITDTVAYNDYANIITAFPSP